MTIRTEAGKILFTYADLVRHTPKDSWGHELLGGEMVVSDAPSVTHQRIVKNIALRLYDTVERSGHGEVFLSPLDVVLEMTTVLQPDLLVVLTERRDIVVDGCLQGAPNLVVEVLSPATERRDRTQKTDLYLSHGVQEVWLVDPSTETVEVVTRDPQAPHRGPHGRGHSVPSRVATGIDIATVFGPP